MEVLQDTYRTINFGPKEYEVPNEWKVLKIKETSTLKGRIGWQGLTTKEYLKEGDYFLITGTDFKNGRIDWENCHFVDQDRFDQDAKIQIKKNDILITKDGTIGKVAIIASELSKPGTLNSGVFVLRPTNKDYLPIFMYYYLNSFFFSSFISQIKAGSTIAHLYQKDFEKYTFLVPSLPEQQKIAAILSTVDEQISSTDKIIKKSKELKKGLMQKLFSEGIGHTEFKDTKIGRIPKDWELSTLYEIRKQSDRHSFTGGPFGSDLKSSDYTDSGVRIIQLGNIGEGSFIDKSKIYTSEEKANQLISCNVYPNDIILAKMAPVARSCKVPSSSSRYVMCSDGIRLAVDTEKVDNNFIFHSLQDRRFRASAERCMVGTTRGRIGLNDLRNLLIPFPPLPEQQKIAAILSEADAKIEEEQIKKAKLETLKKGLMQQLLTGEKRVKV